MFLFNVKELYVRSTTTANVSYKKGEKQKMLWLLETNQPRFNSEDRYKWEECLTFLISS